jgi:diguanylate cyclase (GGDEF)-like protein
VIALVLAWLLYAVYVGAAHRLGLADLGGPISVDAFFKTWLFSSLVLAAAVVCIVRAGLVPKDRVAWAVLGTGMASWALGSIYWSLFLKNLESPPYPSVADFLYLGFYPAAYAGLMLLARKRIRGIGPSVWLDGLVGVLAVGALGTAFVVPAVVADTGGSPAVVITNLAYPLGDLLLIALMAGLFAIWGWRPGPAWLLIGAGLMLLAAADTLYLYRIARDAFVEGTLLDAVWPAGMVLLAAAAWQRERSATSYNFEGWGVLVAPSVFTLGSLGVLIYGNTSGVNAAALILAAGCIVAALVRFALSFREVRTLAESRRQATTDELTGLANRRFLFERLMQTLGIAKRTRSPVTLLIADLDGFKELNDTLGHEAGDLLLKQLGPRMIDALSASDSLARLGGDEFAVLLPRTDADAAVQVVERIQAALETGFSVRGLTIHIEASFGLASYPEHAEDMQTLLQRADVAMYQAKEARCGHQIYAPERDVHSRDRLSLLGELRRAMDDEELVLHYQPKTELESGRVTGVEALIRWEHPERGLLPPVEFLPVVERTGLMRPLTLYVLERALLQARVWHDEGLELTMAVNLSAPNLLDQRLPDDVASLLGKTRMGPRWLQLEVTENIIMADPWRVIGVLDRLRQLGVGLSLDDFGSGTSSLQYLKRLPVDELKIDKSFVLAMEESPADAVIVRCTADLGRQLGLRVVAEGVESAESLRELAAVGCEEAQGFYLQRPLPPDELRAWLDSRDSNGNGPQPAGLLAATG